jgi:SulP family sulfate permease
VNAAILMALLIGILQTLITLLRLGDLSRYISHAVIVGFTLGAAVLLVLDQFKNLLGLEPVVEAREHFLVRFWHTLLILPQTNPWTVAVGAGTALVVLALHVVNRRRGWQIPEFLCAIAIVAFLTWLLGLDTRGVRVIGDTENIPRALPAPKWPSFSWEQARELAGSALAIAVLGLLEAVAMAKAIAARTGQKLDVNQQCLSEGLANLSGSFFQCMPGSGSLTRSAINVHAGAVSQWSGVFSAAAVAATVLLLAPLAHYIPRAALAAILMISAWRLVDRKQLFYHLRTTRFDARIVLVTAVSAVVVSVEFCILIGVFLSFVMFVPRAARLQVTELVLTPERTMRERLDSDPRCNRLAILSLEGELFFGSAPDLEKHFEMIGRRVREGVRVVVLRLKRVRNPDAVCLELFERFLEQMARQQTPVLFCGVRRDMAKVFHKCGIDAKLGPGRLFLEKPAVFSSTLEAVRAAYDLLQGDVCATCPRRTETSKDTLYYMI